MNGASGIPREGREAEYATELWLEGPSAFWLHPEGPLSETTPNEYLAKRKRVENHPQNAQIQSLMGAYANAGLHQSAYAVSAYHSMKNAQEYRNGLMSIFGRTG